MTDPNSARRRGKRGGRHRRDVPPRASKAVPEEQARWNREQAFGTEARPWLGHARQDGQQTPPPADRPSTDADRTEAMPPVDDAQEGPWSSRSARRGRRAARPVEESETSSAPETEQGAAPSGDDSAPSGDDSAPTALEETAVHSAWEDPDAVTSEPTGPERPAQDTEHPAPADHGAHLGDETNDDDSADDRGRADDAHSIEGRGTHEDEARIRHVDDIHEEPANEDSAPHAAAALAGGGAVAASASGRGGDRDRTRRRTDLLAERGRSRTKGGRPGSLPLVAAWTALTTVVPGAGLLTTPMRRFGWALLAVMVTLTLAAVGFVVFTDPLRSGLRLVTSRGVLIAVLIGAIAFGLVWCGQILLTGLAQSNRQRLRGRKRVIAMVLAVALAVVVALPFGRGVQSLWAAQGLLGSDTVFSGTTGQGRTVAGKDPWKDVGRINIMMLGQDAGADRTGTRPDTIMVASIDTETGRTALFSIPRNLEHVRFPEGTVAAERFPDGFRYFGRNQDLINAVWTWAEEEKDLFPKDVKDPGLTATQWAVEETLGLKIDYYAMVNLQGFEDLVNAIGGVEMNVERRIPIGGGINQATGGKNRITGYIEPGEQKLDGYHALWYARSREGSDDFNRMCRQQRIVRVVTEEANPQTLAMSVPGLVDATEKNIETSIPQSDIDAFVELGLRIKDAGFTSYPITPDVTKPYNADWKYLKKWVQASIDESMKHVEATSVSGEKDTAATGGTKGTASDGGSSATPSETPSESATPSEDPTSESPEKTSEPSKEPEVEKDPLRSCMPGYDEEQDQQGNG